MFHIETRQDSILPYASLLERRRLDLLPFIKEVARLLKRTLPEDIAISLDAGTGQYLVEADPTRLQQVMMNLAVNARDAMPQGRELSIGLSRLALALARGQQPPLPDMAPGEYVRLSLRDSGKGIPADALPHIFEPFFTTKSRGKGTDLVLSDMIMPEMGGADLHRQLQAEQPGPRMLFISGYPLHDEGNGFLQREDVAWIQKPFARDELAQKIRQILDEPD